MLLYTNPTESSDLPEGICFPFDPLLSQEGLLCPCGHCLWSTWVYNFGLWTNLVVEHVPHMCRPEVHLNTLLETKVTKPKTSTNIQCFKIISLFLAYIMCVYGCARTSVSVCLCVQEFVFHSMCGSQRTTFGGQFSPSMVGSRDQPDNSGCQASCAARAFTH